jgi:transcriptional regulator with XRE-family HTH domain
MAVDLRGRLVPTTVLVVAGRTGVVWVDRVRLRAARRAQGLTQTDVGERLGHRGKDQISKWERGDRRPDVHALRQLADLYEVDVLDLLADGTARTIEVWRIRAGLTQAETAQRVAQALGPAARMSRETWAALERGQRQVAPEELDPVAEVLGIEPAQVLAAAGTTPTTVPEVVELTPDQVDQLNARRRPGQSLTEVLTELLGQHPPGDGPAAGET